ncbi:MAG: hypothetical protein KKH94_13890, partial [Candidatus Omnitrophica bacterium]|nr:hypothetical protein [Candidatus Omnitrophota bacterium]
MANMTNKDMMKQILEKVGNMIEEGVERLEKKINLVDNEVFDIKEKVTMAAIWESQIKAEVK